VSPSFSDLGYTEPEPNLTLIEFLKTHPEFREVCKAHGWWLETVAQVEKELAG
jgi:hypothetical protein